jgi:ABC-type transport system substrate-binding protein
MARAAGGSGEVAAHWLPPAVAGHDESGGAEGPRNAWLAAPEGDLAQARAYLREAGRAGARLRGRPLVALVADRAPDRAVAEVVRRSLAPLGVSVRVRTGSPAQVARGCRAPAMTVDLCPAAALTSAVRDPEAVLRAGLDAWGPLRSDWAAGAVSTASAAADGESRAWRWAEANRAVLQAVPGVPWRWEERRLLVSRDVRGVADERAGVWDLGATALRER